MAGGGMAGWGYLGCGLGLSGVSYLIERVVGQHHVFLDDLLAAGLIAEGGLLLDGHSEEARNQLLSGFKALAHQPSLAVQLIGGHSRQSLSSLAL